MQTTITDRLEKTREQIRKWAEEGRQTLAEQSKTIKAKGEDALTASKEKLQASKSALDERKHSLIEKGHDTLDSGRGAIVQAEATVLETTRELLAWAGDALGPRAAFVKRGEAALAEALVDLRAGHAATLPIADYSSLPIKEIEPLLDALDLAGLRTLHAYESKNKARKTLLKDLDTRIEAATPATA